MPSPSWLLPLTAFASIFLGATATQAGPPVCSCENLESLQQEYRNAVYLEKFMRQMAEVLKAEEQRLQGLKSTSNSDPDKDLAIQPTVLALRDSYMARNMKLPFPKVKGYTGPTEVNMPYGSCDQSKADLDAMEAGSPCEAIADATAAHELAHRDLCRAMGAQAYWDRLPSVKALEEAERYRAQAANMKSELGRVLDKAEIRLRGEWRHTVAGQGAQMVYFYEFESGDLTPASSGGDRWSFQGKGETQNSLESMTAPGVTCTGDGAVRNAFTVTMVTDGLTFGLDYTEQTGASDMKVTCRTPDGTGMGMAMPTAETSSGQLASSQPLVAGDNPIPAEWAGMMTAALALGGMSVSGEPKTTLSLTCPRP